MRRITTLVLKALMVGLFIAPLMADEALLTPTPKDSMVRELMEVSGLNRHLDLWAKGIKADLDRMKLQVKDPVPKKTFERYYRAFTHAFDPAVMKLAMSTGLTKELSLDDLQAAIAWFKRDTAQLIVKAETVELSAEFLRGLEDYLRSIEAEGPDEDRVDLVSRVDNNAWFGSEYSIRTIALKNRILAMSLSLEDPEHSQGADYRSYRVMEAVTMRLQPLMKMILLYVYEKIPDKQLQEYARELTTVSMKRFERQVSKQMGEIGANGLTQAAKEFKDKDAKKEVGALSESVPL